MSLVRSASRALVALFWLATSAYAYLISIPFVFEQFLAPGLVPGLEVFARTHGWLSLLAPVLTVVALWPALQHPATMTRVGLLVGLQNLAAALFASTHPFVTLHPGGLALGLSAAALVPVLWLASIDLAGDEWHETEPAGNPTGRDALAALSGALAVALLYGMTAASAGGATVSGGAQSLSAHLLLFATFYCAIVVVRSVAAFTSRRTTWEAVGSLAVLSLSTGATVVLVVLPALSVTGGAERLVGALFGGTIGLLVGARGLRAERLSGADGVVAVLGGIVPRWARTQAWAPRLLWAAGILAAALALRAASASMDWNFVVAKLSAVVVWFVVLATALLWAPSRVRLHTAVPYGACLVVLVAHMGVSGRLVASVEAAETSADAWVVGDPSFRTIRDWLRPGVSDLTDGSTDAGAGFFDYLAANTNIGRGVAVEPVPVALASLEAAAPGSPPHIFVFVVDSLRRDYLSPYDDAVTFTPAIGRFADDSTVFTRAFTRYGATGLSVPSIWTGGMILHKQYVLPYAPMNALEQLLEHHRYRRWMSVDNIVAALMPDASAREELEASTGVADFRLCRALDDVRARLDSLMPGGPPTFVWSLPQDVHVAVINREGNRPVDRESYGGFFAPYASRVRRFDACFGDFIDDLQRRGLYEESVIVLTSDHGDSLGEEGRWGHAYTIFPEVVQVPLIVHVPRSRRADLTVDPSALAFTTDITPTLYALAGHDVSSPSPIFGRPLFQPAGSPMPAPEPFGLVASSYGSVYGWLEPDGRHLYIADGVMLRDYLYELDGSPAGVARLVGPETRRRGQTAIRAGVRAIADFYRFDPTETSH